MSNLLLMDDSNGNGVRATSCNRTSIFNINNNNYNNNNNNNNRHSNGNSNNNDLNNDNGNGNDNDNDNVNNLIQQQQNNNNNINNNNNSNHNHNLNNSVNINNNDNSNIYGNVMSNNISHNATSIAAAAATAVAATAEAGTTVSIAATTATTVTSFSGSNGNSINITLHVANSNSTEDLSQSLSEYTDADESISAPTEFLAEFLSAVMLKDYKKALKYCKLILQYEPNNGTAKEFYPLILDKLRAAGSSDSVENYNKSSSSREFVLDVPSSEPPSAGESDVDGDVANMLRIGLTVITNSNNNNMNNKNYKNHNTKNINYYNSNHYHQHDNHYNNNNGNSSKRNKNKNATYNNCSTAYNNFNMNISSSTSRSSSASDNDKDRLNRIDDDHNHGPGNCIRLNLSDDSVEDIDAEDGDDDVDDIEDDDDDNDEDADADIMSSSGDDLPNDDHQILINDIFELESSANNCIAIIDGNGGKLSRNSSSGSGIKGQSTHSDNTTHSYSSLLLEEEDDIVPGNLHFTKDLNAPNLDVSNGNKLPSASCSDSESPTEPLTQRLVAILRSKCSTNANTAV